MSSCFRPAGALLLLLMAGLGCKELEKLIQQNQAPVIDRVAAARSQLSPLDTTTVSVEARDPEGSALAYAWTASGGMLSSTTGSSVRWTAPAVAGDYRLAVKVRDDMNGEAEGAATLSVIAIERPVVAISRLASGAYIPGLGEILLEAPASHPNGIERVEFYANGSLLGTDNSSPYQQTWRVEGLSGTALLLVKAFRARIAGEPGVDSVRVSLEGATRL